MLGVPGLSDLLRRGLPCLHALGTGRWRHSRPGQHTVDIPLLLQRVGSPRVSAERRRFAPLQPPAATETGIISWRHSWLVGSKRASTQPSLPQTNLVPSCSSLRVCRVHTRLGRSFELPLYSKHHPVLYPPGAVYSPRITYPRLLPPNGYTFTRTGQGAGPRRCRDNARRGAGTTEPRSRRHVRDLRVRPP